MSRIPNPYETPAPSTRDEPSRRVYRDSEDELLDNSAAVRTIGAIAMTLGLWLGHAAIYLPLQAALVTQRAVQWHSTFVSVSLVFVVCGALMLVLGRHTRKVIVYRWCDASVLNVTCTAAFFVTAIFLTEHPQYILDAIQWLRLR